jgi:hypothetical protein
MAILDHLDRRPTNSDAGVRIGPGALPDEGRIAALVGYIRGGVEVGQADGEQVAERVVIRRRVLVAQTKSEGQLRREFPSVVDIDSKAILQVFGVADGDSGFGLVKLAKQKFRE